jgi:hypothetical protein
MASGQDAVKRFAVPAVPYSIRADVYWKIIRRPIAAVTSF